MRCSAQYENLIPQSNNNYENRFFNNPGKFIYG